jgi:hypothetical protein
MNNAQIVAFRNLHTSTLAAERTMTTAEMGASSWGKVWADVNVAPDGTRWAFDARRNLFVAY